MCIVSSSLLVVSLYLGVRNAQAPHSGGINYCITETDTYERGVTINTSFASEGTVSIGSRDDAFLWRLFKVLVIASTWSTSLTPSLFLSL